MSKRSKLKRDARQAKCKMRHRSYESNVSNVGGLFAIGSAYVRGTNKGIWRFDGTGIQDVGTALELHEQQRDLVSQGDIKKALAEVERRVLTGAKKTSGIPRHRASSLQCAPLLCTSGAMGWKERTLMPHRLGTPRPRQ